MDHKDYIKQILSEHEKIETVYWVGSGGSLIDLYPANTFIAAESNLLSSHWYTSKEFTITPPKRLGKHSLTIICSHSGNTKESVEAAMLASKRGSAVLVFTSNSGSTVDKPDYKVEVYPWDDGVPTAKVPLGASLALAAELIHQQEGNLHNYTPLLQGITNIDEIIINAKEAINRGMTAKFADLCKENHFFYILGSGASFSQTYGFAICSLMEMQWQHCSYINSAEYFHGPIEVTENGVFFFLQMGSGASREMDERAFAFLKTHTDKLMVLDTLSLGMSKIDFSVRDYLDPVLLYAMNCEFRAARGRLFNHPVETRRYMGIVNY